MATGRKVVTDEENEGATVYDLVTTTAPLDDLRKAKLAEFDIDEENNEREARVHIALIGADGMEYRVWQGDLMDYNLKDIAMIHGSGKYRRTLYLENAQGKIPKRKSDIVGYKLTPPEERERQRLNSIDDTPHAAQAVTPQMIAQMVAEAVRAAMPQQPQQTQADPFMMFGKFVELQRSLAPVSTAAQTDPMSLIRMGMEISQLGNGGGEKESTIETLLGKVIDTLGPTFANVLANKAGAPAPAPMLPHIEAPAPGAPVGVGTFTDPAPYQPNPTDTAMPANQPTDANPFEQIRGALGFAVNMAALGVDPAPYANMVADALESDPNGALDQLLSAPDDLIIAKMAEINPGVEKHRDWFMRQLTMLRDMYADEPGAPGEGAVTTP